MDLFNNYVNNIYKKTYKWGRIFLIFIERRIISFLRTSRTVSTSIDDDSQIVFMIFRGVYL